MSHHRVTILEEEENIGDGALGEGTNISEDIVKYVLPEWQPVSNISSIILYR
jgi:hypothetical protein